MKKMNIFIIGVFVVINLLLPINVNATTSDNTNKISDYILIMDKEKNKNKNQGTTLEDLEDWNKEYDQEQDCDPANSMLGDPEDEDSVAWLLQQLLNYIKILGPILVVVLSSLDFAKVIIQSDDEAMAKAQKKLIYRLLLAAALFFIPTLVMVLLNLFGITSDPTCGIH